MAEEPGWPPAQEAALPTVQETAQALAAIDADRKAGAALALRTLCERVIEAVCAVDRELQVSLCTHAIHLYVVGPGSFRLDVEDFGTKLPPEFVEEMNAYLSQRQPYDKSPRSVQLDATQPGEPHAPAPEGSAGLPVAEVGGAGPGG